VEFSSGDDEGKARDIAQASAYFDIAELQSFFSL